MSFFLGFSTSLARTGVRVASGRLLVSLPRSASRAAERKFFRLFASAYEQNVEKTLEFTALSLFREEIERCWNSSMSLMKGDASVTVTNQPTFTWRKYLDPHYVQYIKNIIGLESKHIGF